MLKTALKNARSLIVCKAAYTTLSTISVIVVVGIVSGSLTLGVIAGAATYWAGHIAAPPGRDAQFLPWYRVAYLWGRALIAGTAVLMLGQALAVAGSTMVSGSAVLLASIAMQFQRRNALHSRPALRCVLLGPPDLAETLSVELRAGGSRPSVLVGRLPLEGEISSASVRDEIVPVLGKAHEYADAVVTSYADLVVVAPGLAKSPAVDALVEMCIDSGVRMVGFEQFYEAMFGHVPLAMLDSEWFRFIIHPQYRSGIARSSRGMDLAVALCVTLLVLPTFVVLALLVRLDGGPVFYRQKRIGEGGRVFTIYKLRSMRVQTETAQVWSSADDDRVTKVGRFMRKTHLDELPQLINVLRGDMSIVGPRPEQPHLAQQLGEEVRYYSRRHAVRPGVTGWAQIQCGYAGSSLGSRLKASYDLYYVKHRCFKLDVQIVVETFRTLVADRQWDDVPESKRPVLSEGPVATRAASSDANAVLSRLAQYDTFDLGAAAPIGEVGARAAELDCQTV